VLAGWSSLPGPVLAQGTAADYERANNLRRLTQSKVTKSRVEPHWLSDNQRFWYRNDLPGGGREFILVDAEKGTRAPAFDAARVAAALEKALGKPVRPTQLPVDRIDFDGPTLLLYQAGRAWRCDLSNYELREAKDASKPAAALPPGRARPSRRTGAETAITFVNKTGADAVLFWIDSDGERRQYATIRPGDEHRQHTFAGHVWLAADGKGKELGVFEATDDPATAVIGESTPAKSEPKPRRPEDRRGGRSEGPSPAGRWQVRFRDSNLFLRGEAGGEEWPLTTDGKADDEYSGRVWWSPDAKRLVVLRTKKGDDRKVYYVESSPRDQVQPKLHSYDYLKPGDRIPQARPHLFDVEARKEIPISGDLFPNPWSITDLRWNPDSKGFTFLYNERGHQVLRVIAVDAATGQARTIIDERSKTFVDYSGKCFARYLDRGGEIVWMSERDGWNHLYLYDTATGQVKNQITRGPWVVRGVDRVDEEKRQVWFHAGGIRPSQDPYYLHYARVNFDGTGLVILTEGDGTHEVRYSPDGRFLLDTWSRVDQPPVTELRRADDGKLVCKLEAADWSELLATGWKAPERFVAKGRDGATDIYGVLFRPSTFDASRKYPVVEEIYAGPQGSFVPKAFSPMHGPQAIAELGFLVVKIDGMGTSNRSKAFHDVCWKNLGDAGFPDRILWMKAAAAKHPSMDLTRVGIYGGSAGGQNALRALLAHGDFYKVAVADCGCHDNRMDKIWWNELWMGWPVGPHYDEQSNVTQAHRLQGKLLLVVGEMDENVDPASTLQVAAALQRANKDYELLIVAGRGHGAAESPYGSRRRQDFLVRHLLGVEPQRP
jgi:dipeptidyl aminopeptidase/acylaminoacyl peptidase